MISSNEMTQIVDLTDKIAIMNNIKNYRKTQMKSSRSTEIKVIKRNQMQILELRSIGIRMKISLSNRVSRSQ